MNQWERRRVGQGRQHSQSHREATMATGGGLEAGASRAVLARGRDSGQGCGLRGGRHCHLLLCKPSAACPHPCDTPAYSPHPDPFSFQASCQALDLGLPHRLQSCLSFRTALDCELRWFWAGPRPGAPVCIPFCVSPRVSLHPRTRTFCPGAQCLFLASRGVRWLSPASSSATVLLSTCFLGARPCSAE